MFRMFFVSFIVVFSLYQLLSKLDVVVLTTLLLDLIHASGITLPLFKRKNELLGYSGAGKGVVRSM